MTEAQVREIAKPFYVVGHSGQTVFDVQGFATALEQARVKDSPFFDVVFDGPPAHESGRFVECEDHNGQSFDAGDWIERDDGLWALRIKK